MEANHSFSSKLPGFQLAWDSTSLGMLKTCPKMYYYSMLAASPDVGALAIGGYETRLESVHLKFGICYHSALEAYDKAKASGLDHEHSLHVAVQRAMVDTWDSELKRPWASDDPNKNRFTLIRTIVWYLDQFADDPAETIILANGKPAVELSFQFELGLDAPTGEPIVLCGHMDKLVSLGGHAFVMDRKTTKHTLTSDYFDQYTPDNQFSLYSLASKVIWSTPVQGLLVDAAQVGVTFSRFMRRPVARTQRQLEEWLATAKWYISTAAHFAKSGEWPMNDKACFRCAFRPICSKDPLSRGQWLKSDYKPRVWNPLRVRGDI